MYVPAVLVLGFIAPEVASIVNPEVELNVPPVDPVITTGSKPELVVQNGPL